MKLLARLNIQDIIVWTFGLSLFTLPSPFVNLNAQLIIALFILSAVLFVRKKPEKIQYLDVLCYSLFPITVSLFSLIFISHQSLKEFEKEGMALILPLATFFLLNANFKISERGFVRLILCFVLAVLMILCYTYIRSFFYNEEFFAHEFLTFNIIHPGYFSFYCGVVILIILELTKTKSKVIRLLTYLSILAILFYMTLLSSRMPLYSILLILLWSFLNSSISLKKRISYSIGIGIFFFVMVIVVYNSPRLKYRFYEAVEKNLAMRIIEWRGSLRVFEGHPVFGVGNGNSQKFLDQYYYKNTEDPEKYLGFNSHNYFLHTLMTYGIVGTTLILFFWFKVFKYSLGSTNFLFTKILILFLLCSLTELMWVRQKGIVFFYLFYSLTLLYRPERLEKPDVGD